MSKSLVIVESPAKAKTISKYLGSEYIVQSSVGHIRDLPKKERSLQEIFHSQRYSPRKSKAKDFK